MAEESLRELLLRVRTRLAESRALDGESRQLLGTVVRDIEQALGAPPVAPAAAPVAAAAHARRVESLAVRFEASHPALAETLRELMDALVKAGI
jgi:Domain of unknown function (DUF4404)